ncbi:1-acyl-sn-glycerol-3-phosphate acyltransferase [Marivita sp. GX14005]|uniref:1-acyl-sn-glycerol-3-phosphate acyltransferase n=1 Tax=Marivita sp. GX14005 TaxID=2942276 RepID=UPI002019966E|nr:1-acyl-sn-glycerol-3-phosphate acyltransferase [Marivita sp. GX14005]MCL3883031.1 1-acyl-sn-glycerol-3-phosphate acyltransferase [Marivita sp. GX14005]
MTSPTTGDASRIARQAQAVFRRLFLSWLDGKLITHLDHFEGSEHLPERGPVILVPNHESYFDGFAITALMWKIAGRHVRIPTNVKALGNPFVAFCQTAGGAVPIDPADREQTYARLSALLERGEAVVLFPEGTRSDGTAMHPFKLGAFNLAVAHGVPILPVALRGFAGILPKGQLRFRRGARGGLVFGPPVDPADSRFAGRDAQETARHLRAHVRGWLEEAALDPPAVERKTREIAALARRADVALEALLDGNAELITRRDAARVRRIVSACAILGQFSFDLDLQDVRAQGFQLADLPPYRAVFALPRYRARLSALLRQRENHSYLNYCAGLLQLRLPRLLGGGDAQEALRRFKAAHDAAARDGYPQARFAHGLATALARTGARKHAIALLQDTFDGPQTINGPRALRRRERGMALMSKLQRSDPSTPDLPSRPLRGFELVMAQTRISDIIVGQIEGVLDFAQVFDAASALQQRHPGLRARVVWPEGRDARSVFEYLPADQTRLHVTEARPPKGARPVDRPFWQEVAEREVNHLFDLSDGYMFRVTWLPESGHVILNAQHSVIDGVSLMRLLHDFARHCAGQELGPNLPPTPPALRSAPKLSLLEKAVGLVHRESFLRARSRFAEWSPLPIAGRLEKGETPATECYFAEGDSASFDAITAACHAHGVTVGGAYAAAIQCAMLHISGASFGGKQKYYVPMDFSLRRFIAGADAAQEAVGLFSGVAPVIFDGDPSASFWELAASFTETSRGEIKHKSPVIFHQVFDRFFNLEKAYARYRLGREDGGGAGGPLTMSNVGKFPFPPQTGAVRINAVHGMSASQKGGSMLYFWLRSVNGRLFYSATSMAPAATRDFGAAFFDLVVFLMERSTGADASNLPLRDYIPRAAAEHRAKANTRLVPEPEPVV